MVELWVPALTYCTHLLLSVVSHTEATLRWQLIFLVNLQFRPLSYTRCNPHYKRQNPNIKDFETYIPAERAWIPLCFCGSESLPAVRTEGIQEEMSVVSLSQCRLALSFSTVFSPHLNPVSAHHLSHFLLTYFLLSLCHRPLLPSQLIQSNLLDRCSCACMPLQHTPLCWFTY